MGVGGGGEISLVQFAGSSEFMAYRFHFIIFNYYSLWKLHVRFFSFLV